MNKFLACCLVCLPLKSFHLTSSYGVRIHPVTGKYAFHAGIDLRASHDTVYSIMPGTFRAGADKMLGNYVVITSGDLICTYGHLSQILISGRVDAGDPIGITGATGRVTAEHLHLGIKLRERPIDPLKFLYQIIKDHE